MRASGLRYELLRVETRYQWYRRDGVWDFEPVKTTRRVADGEIDAAAGDAGAHRGSGAVGPLPARGGDCRSRRTGYLDRLRRRLVCIRPTADTPDMLEVALDKPEYAAGEVMTVAVTARTAGKVTVNVIGDRLVATVAQDVPAGTARIRVPVGSDWGTGAYRGRDLAPSARQPGRAHARPRHRRAVVRHQPQGAHARARPRRCRR